MIWRTSFCPTVSSRTAPSCLIRHTAARFSRSTMICFDKASKNESVSADLSKLLCTSAWADPVQIEPAAFDFALIPHPDLSERCVPAQLTNASSRFQRAATASATRRPSTSRLTSASKTNVSAPVPRHTDSTLHAASRVLLSKFPIATDQPARAKRIAVAAPMPFAAPVIMQAGGAKCVIWCSLRSCSMLQARRIGRRPVAAMAAAARVPRQATAPRL